MTVASSVHNNEEESTESVDYKRFFHEFYKARGAVTILIVSSLLSFGVGSVIGLVRGFLCSYEVCCGFLTTLCHSFRRFLRQLLSVMLGLITATRIRSRAVISTVTTNPSPVRKGLTMPKLQPRGQM
jgi:hypothetical protein